MAGPICRWSARPAGTWSTTRRWRIRIAEQAAMLDVISGGRLEMGIGRGYQPRESEVLGGVYGSTIQDDERNRSYYQEAYAIILKCWTEPSFSYHGEFFHIPPSYTRWNHAQTIAYFSQPDVGRTLDQVLKLGEPNGRGAGNPVMDTTTTLREISVYPQPLQKPYPQMWEPTTSSRTIRWCAQNGVNCFSNPFPIWRMKRHVEQYYAECEQAGWPD